MGPFSVAFSSSSSFFNSVFAISCLFVIGLERRTPLCIHNISPRSLSNYNEQQIKNRVSFVLRCERPKGERRIGRSTRQNAAPRLLSLPDHDQSALLTPNHRLHSLHTATLRRQWYVDIYITTNDPMLTVS